MSKKRDRQVRRHEVLISKIKFLNGGKFPTCQERIRVLKAKAMEQLGRSSKEKDFTIKLSNGFIMQKGFFKRFNHLRREHLISMMKKDPRKCLNMLTRNDILQFIAFVDDRRAYFQCQECGDTKIRFIHEGIQKRSKCSCGKTKRKKEVKNKDKKPNKKPKIYKGEEQCRSIFEDLFKCKFPRHRPEWLKNPVTKHNLELDGYNKKLKLAFEHDGEHHFRLSKYNDFNDELLELQQHRDRLKDQECSLRGIVLIRIPYTVRKKDLKSYIINELQKYKVDIIDQVG